MRSGDNQQRGDADDLHVANGGAARRGMVEARPEPRSTLALYYMYLCLSWPALFFLKLKAAGYSEMLFRTRLHGVSSKKTTQ